MNKLEKKELLRKAYELIDEVYQKTSWNDFGDGTDDYSYEYFEVTDALLDTLNNLDEAIVAILNNCND